MFSPVNKSEKYFDSSVKNYQHIENFTSSYERLVDEFLESKKGQRSLACGADANFEQYIEAGKTNLVDGVIPGIKQVANDLSLQTITFIRLWVNT